MSFQPPKLESPHAPPADCWLNCIIFVLNHRFTEIEHDRKIFLYERAGVYYNQLVSSMLLLLKGSVGMEEHRGFIRDKLEIKILILLF